jgi:hypothetical protein
MNFYLSIYIDIVSILCDIFRIVFVKKNAFEIFKFRIAFDDHCMNFFSNIFYIVDSSSNHAWKLIDVRIQFF